MYTAPVEKIFNFVYILGNIKDLKTFKKKDPETEGKRQKKTGNYFVIIILLLLCILSVGQFVDLTSQKTCSLSSIYYISLVMKIKIQQEIYNKNKK
jgi:amino acid transporter